MEFYRVSVRFLSGATETFEEWDRDRAERLAAFAASSPGVEFVSFATASA